MIVSFCDIARCRKVFKLETMGDCYVVMTGLWNAGKDHVVPLSALLCCVIRFHDATRDLKKELGLDTVCVSGHGRCTRYCAVNMHAFHSLRQHKHCIMDGKQSQSQMNPPLSHNGAIAHRGWQGQTDHSMPRKYFCNWQG